MQFSLGPFASDGTLAGVGTRHDNDPPHGVGRNLPRLPAVRCRLLLTQRRCVLPTDEHGSPPSRRHRDNSTTRYKGARDSTACESCTRLGRTESVTRGVDGVLQISGYRGLDAARNRRRDCGVRGAGAPVGGPGPHFFYFSRRAKDFCSSRTSDSRCLAIA